MLLFDREFVRRLHEDVKTAHEMYIMTLSLSKAIMPIVAPILQASGNVSIITNRFLSNNRQFPDHQEVYEELKRLGCAINFVRGAFLHHQKIILLPPAICYIGSHNITAAALFSNFECSVRFEDAPILQQLLSRFHSFL